MLGREGGREDVLRCNDKDALCLKTRVVGVVVEEGGG